MAKNGELLQFVDVPAAAPFVTPEDRKRSWKILVVDDETDVHRVTQLALRDISYENDPLELLSAYSGDEARRLIEDDPSIALVLLDVVMETDDAGLRLVRYIREDLNNRAIRIVLRTGQPGAAPERQVIVDYDINDYKSKSELTSAKLFTLVQASLRSYQDIRKLERQRFGLEKLVDASAHVFELQSMERFASGIIEQIVSLLNLGKQAACVGVNRLATSYSDDRLDVIAASGDFSAALGKNAKAVLPPEVIADIQEALRSKSTFYCDRRLTTYSESGPKSAALTHLQEVNVLDDVDRGLIDVFTRNIGVSFNNIQLRLDFEQAQQELVYMLCEAVEMRSRETGNHIRRIAQYSRLLAVGCGLSDAEVEMVTHASPLHDIGKIGIPDAILNKPGKFEPEEWRIMQTHAQLGGDLLKVKNRPLFEAGRIIASQHHEKWDGSGYPAGLKGDGIHLFGRIVALADVFDAIGSDRCYKKAWPLQECLDFIKAQRGRHFDPRLVDLFFANLGAYLEVRERFPDAYGGAG